MRTARVAPTLLYADKAAQESPMIKDLVIGMAGSGGDGGKSAPNAPEGARDGDGGERGADGAVDETTML